MNYNNTELLINTIRTLSMDAVQKANSGHPGTPMALAPLAYTLYNSIMKHNPTNPDWLNRDRFILSAGHASMLLYSTLFINGYDLSLDDIKNFRQLESKCAGHPEFGITPGVETTTGPLGQGFATSVGMAIAQKWLAERYNKPGYDIFDYCIYSAGGDGCIMEGISSEAASIAGHLGLDNLIWFYDDNNITIEGETELAFSEDVQKRFEAKNWLVLNVIDINDTKSLNTAISQAKDQTEKPTLIITKSHIGFGAPTKQDTHGAHGAPLGDEEIAGTKKNYGWDPDKTFHIPTEVEKYQKDITAKGKNSENEWSYLFSNYKNEFPKLAAEVEQIKCNSLPENWDETLSDYQADSKGLAGRAAGGTVMNRIAENIPWFVGGSADLSPSTKTYIKASSSISKGSFQGQNLHYGIREHAMGAIANGLALSKLRTHASTFLVFSDYMKSSVRLSALMGLPVVYVYTHDSICVGEDGPTHQPVEQIVSLRSIPGLLVMRPGDANETNELWKYSVAQNDNPVAMILSRQNLPTHDRNLMKSRGSSLNGGYIFNDCEGNPEIILVATGSEVSLCVDAQTELEAKGIRTRVVSMPCLELYENQSDVYKESVLPTNIKNRISVEAGSSIGWHKYTGLDGKVLSVDTFGKSGPMKSVQEHFGFTVANIVNNAVELKKK